MQNETDGWKELYRLALLELDPLKLRKLIVQTEQSIRLRMEQLELSPGSGHPEEKHHIADALHVLRMLRRDESLG